jgi:hypothetical protein
VAVLPAKAVLSIGRERSGEHAEKESEGDEQRR